MDNFKYLNPYYYPSEEKNRETIKTALNGLKDIIDNPNRVYKIERTELPDSIQYRIELSKEV
jgi:hypothetical protein